MMIKCYATKNFLRFALPLFITLLAACSDPDADIKELNKNQLSDVLDTLYVEKDIQKKTKSTDNASNQASTTDTNDTVTTASSSATTSKSNSSLENKIVSTPTTVTKEIATQSINDSQSTESINTETPIAVLPTGEISAEESPISTDVSESIETQKTEAEKIASSNFSEPTTISQTPAEAILEDIVKKFDTIDYSNSPISAGEAQIVDNFCKKIANRLNSVTLRQCRAANHRVSPFNTVNGLPIVVTEFAPKTTRKPLGKILVIGGTHGDELTSVSTAYKWIANLNKFHSGLFHWHIAPALNADSVLIRPATRQNANGVDINRNLPTPDWEKQSSVRWEKLNNDPRKSPGSRPASEPETQWIIHEIETFKPDAIVSIHAPYGILDFDAPKLSAAPKSFGRLQLNLLGTYPGSLGNYAGIQQQIPVLTLELPNASTMPSQNELAAIWDDMIKWLRIQLKP